MPNIVKKTTFPGLFSLLAPHSCRGCGSLGSPLCDRCKKYIISRHQNLCPICQHSNLTGKCSNCPALPPIFIAGQRSDLLGDLIHVYKYESVRSLAHPLAEILNSVLPLNDAPTVIIPLPTTSQHIRERGFDHTKLIAKHLAKLRPGCTVASLLTRNQNTVQVGSSREARLTQAAKAYQLSKTFTPDSKTTYVLFDDVWTTGASLQSAHALLKKAGTKNIIIAALALSCYSATPKSQSSQLQTLGNK